MDENISCKHFGFYILGCDEISVDVDVLGTIMNVSGPNNPTNVFNGGNGTTYESNGDVTTLYFTFIAGLGKTLMSFKAETKNVLAVQYTVYNIQHKIVHKVLLKYLIGFHVYV